MAHKVDQDSTLNAIQIPNPTKSEKETLKYREDMVEKLVECPRNFAECPGMPPSPWSPSFFFVVPTW
jgi:hypothetical protein